MTTKAFEKLVLTEAAIRFRQLSKSFTNTNIDSANNNKIIQNLVTEFRSIHDFLFQDSSVHYKISDDGKVHNSKNLNEEQAKNLESIITNFVHAIYNNDGSIIQRDQQTLAKIIHNFIVKSQSIALNNADFVCGALLCKLGNSKKFRTIAPNGIDFSRASTSGLSEQTVSEALSNTLSQIDDKDTYPSLPATVVEKNGHKYLGYKIGHKTYIVSETGHLIDDGRHISDVMVIPENAREEEKLFLTALKPRLSAMENSTVDNGLADQSRPIDMNIDWLTGLNTSTKNNESELSEFKKTYKYTDFSNLIKDDKGTIARDISLAEKNFDMRTNTYPADIKARMKKLLPIILNAANKHFVGRNPSDTKPEMYMLQGGTGSGKSNLINKTQQECNGNAVIASLDDSRNHSQLYDLYLASNNHADDYIKFSEFGNAIRTTVIEIARQNKYNLIIDGSGIPYAQRNDELTKQFHDSGYNTNLFAATAYLKAKNQYPDDNTTPAQISDAIKNAQERLEKHHRAVPWKIIQSKHVRFPQAHMEATADINFNRVILWDHTETFTDSPILAFITTKTFSQKDIEEFSNLISVSKGDEFLKTLKEKNALPEGLNAYQTIDPKLVDFKAVKEITSGQYRLQVILNMDHFHRMQVRGLFDENAKGSAGLFINHISCDINGDFRGENGTLKLPFNNATAQLENTTIAGAGQGASAAP